MRTLFTMLLLLASSLTLAQDGATTPETPETEPSPLLHALSLIPDTPEIRQTQPILSYADYQAAIEARGMAVPDSLGGYLAAGEPDGPLAVVIPTSGPQDFLRNLVQGGPNFPVTVGFDFFQIGQAIEIGAPPSNGQILTGDFDELAIRTVYTLRGYTIEHADDTGTLLCPAAGCTEGRTTILANRNPANPFGGHLGRSEPIFVAKDVLLNSPDNTLVETMAETFAGDAPSLADAPEFQALANVLAEYPYVSAVIAVNPLDLAQIDPFWIERQPEAAESLLASIDDDPLAPYQLAAFASAADEETEYGLLLLVYVSDDAAQAAAATLDNRLATMASGRTGEIIAHDLNELGTLEPAQVVTDEETGLAVVVVSVTREQPSNTEVDGEIIWSHRIFRRFTDMYISKDLPFLIWSGGEE